MKLPLQTVGSITAGALALAAALYELWLWRRRPQATSHLWGGLLAVGTGLYAIVHGLPYVLHDVASVLVITRATSVLIIWIGLSTCEYAEALVGRPLPVGRPYRVALAFPLLSVVITTDWIVSGDPLPVPFWGGATFSSLDFNAAYAAMLFLALAGLGATTVWMVRHLDAPAERRVLGIGFGLWVLGGLHDVLMFVHHDGGPAFFMEYGFVAIVLATLSLDIRSYARLLELASKEQRRWQREASDQAQAILELFAAAPLPVLVHRDGQIIHANLDAASSLGASPEDLEGSQLLAWIAPGSKASAQTQLIELDEPGVLSETALLPTTGPVVHWQAKAFELRLSGEDAVVVIAIDVTKKRQLLAQTMTLDRMVATGTLAAGVAHEINNPLTFVMANLHHLREILPGGDPALVELIDEALGGTRRVRDVVQDLRRLAQPHTSSDIIDLKEIVEAAARIIHNEARHSATLEVDVPEVTIQGDRAKLGQVFVALLLNAVEAIPTGRREDHQVLVRGTVTDDDVLVEIVDSGEGIAPELLSQIFDPFFTTKPLGKNTGLGLAIARETVLSAGGDLWLESSPQRGTTVSVRLLRTTQAGAKAEIAPTPTVSLDVPRTILLIDDEASVCRAIRRMVAHRYDVTTTVSAGEALSWLEAGDRSFDAVICDIMMPQLTGRDVHQRIAALSPVLAQTTVFITGGVFGDLEKWAREIDNPVLTKPFDAKDLIDVLDGLFAKRATSAPPTSGVSSSSSQDPSSSSMVG